jgi:hypothetical protein
LAKRADMNGVGSTPATRARLTWTIKRRGALLSFRQSAIVRCWRQRSVRLGQAALRAASSTIACGRETSSGRGGVALGAISAAHAGAAPGDSERDLCRFRRKFMLRLPGASFRASAGSSPTRSWAPVIRQIHRPRGVRTMPSPFTGINLDICRRSRTHGAAIIWS